MERSRGADDAREYVESLFPDSKAGDGDGDAAHFDPVPPAATDRDVITRSRQAVLTVPEN